MMGQKQLLEVWLLWLVKINTILLNNCRRSYCVKTCWLSGLSTLLSALVVLCLVHLLNHLSVSINTHAAVTEHLVLDGLIQSVCATSFHLMRHHAHLVKLIKLHGHRHYLSITHVLEQDLWVADNKGICNVEWFSSYLVVKLAAHSLGRCSNNVSNTTHLLLSALRLHWNVMVQLVWSVIVNTWISSNVLFWQLVGRQGSSSIHSVSCGHHLWYSRKLLHFHSLYMTWLRVCHDVFLRVFIDEVI